MKTLSQIIESSENASLYEFCFESRTFTEVKKEVLKALGISSWGKGDYRNGIYPKLDIWSIKAAPKKKTKYSNYSLSYLYNDEYDKIIIKPNFSYLKEGDYENKVVKSLDKLGSIEGCSYQIINDEKEYKKLLNNQEVNSWDRDYPMVLISIPKSGSTPELPGIPKKQDDLKPEDKQTTEPKADKSKDSSIQFWCTGAGDTRIDYIAYGAMTPDWKPNFSRIQKRLGENKFRMYYTNIPTKKFSSYKSLYNYMKKMWKNTYSDFSIASEEKLIEMAAEETYYIKDYWS